MKEEHYGDDVIELQARLQYIGFYTSQIDGKFGYSTYWALKEFPRTIWTTSRWNCRSNIRRTNLDQFLSSIKSLFTIILIKECRFTHYGGTPLKNQVKGQNEAKVLLINKYAQLPGG